MTQIIRNSKPKGHNQLSIQTITTTTTTFLFCFSVSATFAPKKKRRETITVLLKDCAAIGRREDHVVCQSSSARKKEGNAIALSADLFAPADVDDCIESFSSFLFLLSPTYT